MLLHLSALRGQNDGRTGRGQVGGLGSRAFSLLRGQVGGLGSHAFSLLSLEQRQKHDGDTWQLGTGKLQGQMRQETQTLLHSVFPSPC